MLARTNDEAPQPPAVIEDEPQLAPDVEELGADKEDVAEDVVAVVEEAAEPMANSPETIANIRDLLSWQWEKSDAAARQRPAIIIIVTEDYQSLPDLNLPVPTAIIVAERLANCGYDVKILVGLPDHRLRDAETHHTMGKVCDRIVEINARLKERNAAEKLPREIALLKPIDKPELFANDGALIQLVDHWAAKTFGDPRSNRRPPFGAMYFIGHGEIAGTQQAYLTPYDGGTRATAIMEEMAMSAERRYRAPLWLIGDTCRTEGAGAATPPGPGGAGSKLTPRVFTNKEDLSDPRLTDYIDRIEALRAKSNVGAVRRSEDMIHPVTMMFPNQPRAVVQDVAVQLFGYHLGNLLDAKPSPTTSLRIFPAFDNKKETLYQPSVLSLHSIFNKADTLLTSNPDRKVAPEYRRGPINENMVVVSADRTFIYPRAEIDLLDQGLQVNAAVTGFSVPQDANGFVYGNVEITRPQAAYNSDFKAYFQFRRGIPLLGKESYKLVLNVAASSPTPGDSLPFVVGAYSDKNKQLTSSFANYGGAAAIEKPIACDGKSHWVETPLDLARGADAELLNFEIQANAANPQSWSQNATLTLLGAYVFPLNATKAEMNAVINSYEVAPAGQQLIGQIWFDAPLSTDDRPIAAIVLRTGATQSLALDFGGSTNLSGVLGPLYPKRYLDEKTHVVRLRTKGGDIDGTMVVCLYGDSKLLAVRELSIREARRGANIKLIASGVANELAIVCEGVSGVEIVELQIREGR